MAPCPDGWQELTDPVDGVVLCEPWPAGGRQDCPVGEAHFPGTEGCAPLGAPCPAGDWPEDLSSGVRVLYVRPGASGTGTMASPFGSVDAAYAAAFPGDVIALAKGTHRRVPLGKDIEVVGACAAETRIVPSASDDWAVLAMGASATLRNVSIGPTSGLAIVVSQASTTLTLRGVEVRDATGGAIVVGLGSRAELERLRVVGPRTNTSGQSLGLVIQEESVATLDQGAFEGADEGSIQVTGGGALTMTRVASWGTSAGRGMCLEVERGGTVTGSEVVCEDQSRSGLVAGFGGSTTDLTHLVIRRIVPDAGEFGRGFAAQGDADVTLDKTWIEHATQMAVLLGDEDPTLSATGVYRDLFIRDTQLDSDMLYGSGLIVNGGAHATVERLAIIDSHFDSLVVQNGAQLDATDVTLRGSQPAPVGGNGAALFFGGGTGTLERMDISESRVASGLFDESVVTLRDVAIHETEPKSDGSIGAGLVFVGASEVDGERILVENSRTVQVTLEGWSTGRFVDLTVRDGLPRPSDGSAGVGVQAASGSRLDLTRALIERNRTFGVLVSNGAGMTSSMRDVTIVGTQENECETCSTYGSGLGVFNASATVERFSFRDNSLCGVHLGTGGAADLSMGEVVGSSIGACVGDERYDISRLQSGVDYRDNESNLDSLALPVPDIPPAPDFERP